MDPGNNMFVLSKVEVCIGRWLVFFHRQTFRF